MREGHDGAMSATLRQRATAIVVRAGHVLLVRDRGRRSFALPGGGIDPSELPMSAVARELQEETTLAAAHIAHMFTHSGKYNTHCVFRVDAAGDVCVEADPQVEEFVWWDGKANVPVNPHVSQILDRCEWQAWDRISEKAHSLGSDYDTTPHTISAEYSIAGLSRPSEDDAGKRIRHRATAIVVRGGRVLLMREPGDSKFHLPGGGVDAGELPISAAVRELHEETSLAASAAAYISDYCEFYGGGIHSAPHTAARKALPYWRKGDYWGQVHSIFRIAAHGDVRLSAEHCEFVWWNGTTALPLLYSVPHVLHLAQYASTPSALTITQR